MKSYDYDAVVFDGEVYCVECLPEDVDVEDDDVSPIFADSEWDYAPDCVECGAEHDYMSIMDRDEDADGEEDEGDEEDEEDEDEDD